MATTPRLGLRRPQGSDAFQPAGDITQIVDILDNSALWQSGTLIARPAPNAVLAGTYYFATDRLDLAVSNGSVWITLTPAALCSVQVYSMGVMASPGVQNKLTAASKTVDVGSHFVAGAGAGQSRFTAPVKGMYEFAVSGCAVEFAVGKNAAVSTRINGGTLNNLAFADIGYSATSFNTPLAGSNVLSLAANDYVEIWGWNGDTVNRGLSGFNFSARLLAQIP